MVKNGNPTDEKSEIKDEDRKIQGLNIDFFKVTATVFLF
jgi:hypothetical protein